MNLTSKLSFILVLATAYFELISSKRKQKEDKDGSVLSLFPTTSGYDQNDLGEYDHPDLLASNKPSESHRHRYARMTKSEMEYDEEEDSEEANLQLIEEEADRRRRQAGAAGENKPRRMEDITKLNLPEGYSPYVLPKDPKGNPMPLHIFVNIINILEFDELNEMLQIDLEFTVMWTDFAILTFNNNSDKYNGLPFIDNFTKDELRKKRRTLNNVFILEKIWKPNLFVENLLSIKQPVLMSRPVTIKFIPELGWFEYITRITIKMDCEMDFHKYPADTQECEFSIRGFSYPKKDLNLNWYKHGAFLNDLTLPSFDVIIKSTGKRDLKLRKSSDDDDQDVDDIFELLTFVIAARRNLSYHFVQTYLASTFYIVITTLCFLLPARMIEARIGISMTTLLTLTAMFASVRESTPIVSYVKAIDVWMVGCIFFVFLTLAQFTVHTWITGGSKEEKSASRKSSLKLEETTELLDKPPQPMEITELSFDKPERTIKKGLKNIVVKVTTVSKLVQWATMSERYSFPIFLSIFAIYTIIYWSWLLTTADYFNWKINSTLNDMVDFSDD